MLYSAWAVSILASLAIASPLPKGKSAATTTSVAASAATKAASAKTGGTAGSVLTASAYNDISISGKTAGTAEADAAALFSAIDQTDLANVSKADLDIISGTHDVAEDAEVDAFNPAIDAASGDAADSLQVCYSPA